MPLRRCAAKRVRCRLQRLVLAPDEKMLTSLFRHAHVLGQAYAFTGDERYAERAVAKMRVFFLDPETGMLPSLELAGIRPGVSTTGRVQVCALDERLCALGERLRVPPPRPASSTHEHPRLRDAG